MANIEKTACFCLAIMALAQQAEEMLNKRLKYFYAIAISIITCATSTLMNIDRG